MRKENREQEEEYLAVPGEGGGQEKEGSACCQGRLPHRLQVSLLMWKHGNYLGFVFFSNNITI